MNRASFLTLLVAGVAPAVLPLPPASAAIGVGGPPAGFAHRAQTELLPTKASLEMGDDVALAPGLVVVGDPGQTVDGKAEAGAVLLYQIVSGPTPTLKPVATLTAPDPQPFAKFGIAVATDGTTIVVGSPDATADTTPAGGLVSIYTKPGAGWAALHNPVATIPSFVPSTDGYFGSSVAVEGPTVVVGAPGEVSGNGRVWVYTEPNAGWATPAPPVSLNTTGTADDLGTSVAIDGDLIAAGAPGADLGAPGAGAVDLYTALDSGSWESEGAPDRVLAAGKGVQDQSLGWTVAMYGPYVVGGAPADLASPAGTTGVVDVFKQPAGGWEGAGVVPESAQLTDSASQQSTEFGAEVAIDGSEILASATGQTFDGKSDAGLVDVFDLPKTGYANRSTPNARVSGSAPVTNGLFSDSLADDGSQILVGAPGVRSGGPASAPRGTAYLFTTLPLPGLTGVTESTKSWKASTKLPALNPKRPRTGGTAYRFTANQAMSVTLSFAKESHGHYGAAHKLTLSAVKGKNVLYFGGRLSSSNKLAVGSYRVVLQAKNAASDLSAAHTLRFTIEKGKR